MASKDPTPTRPKTDAAVTSPLGSGAGAVPHSASTVRQQVVLLLVRLRPNAIGWGLAQLMQSPFRRIKDPGLVFQKVLGSGQNGGFGLRPGLNYQGLFSVFDSEDDAASYLNHSAQVGGYMDHAEACLAARLAPVSCRGSWSGFAFRPVDTTPTTASTREVAATAGKRATAANEATMPVASLTRASIRPLRAGAFWAKSPAAEADLARAPGCQLAVGLGEAPLLRQATFSLWESQAAMDAYARSGAHQQAIQAAYGRGFFSESMFVRFRPVALYGQWNGLCFAPWPPPLSARAP